MNRCPEPTCCAVPPFERFTGENDAISFDDWLVVFTNITNGMDEAEAKSIFARCMFGMAAKTYRSLVDAHSLPQIIQEFKKIYSETNNDTISNACHLFDNCIQQKGESALHYIERLRLIQYDLNPTQDDYRRDTWLYAQFMRGALPAVKNKCRMLFFAPPEFLHKGGTPRLDFLRDVCRRFEFEAVNRQGVATDVGPQ